MTRMIVDSEWQLKDQLELEGCKVLQGRPEELSNTPGKIYDRILGLLRRRPGQAS